jgi:hypothetical protein
LIFYGFSLQSGKEYRPAGRKVPAREPTLQNLPGNLITQLIGACGGTAYHGCVSLDDVR